MRTVILFAAVLIALLGCQGQPKPAAKVSAPQLIQELTDQTLVYSCPKCGMDYDAAGKCSMCNVELMPMKVAYLCPVDNQPAERAGKCPRCGTPVKAVKTPVAAAPAGAASGS